MFASYLHRVGIGMGDDLYVDLATNAYGHYEDLDFLNLQRTELAAAFDGQDWLVTDDFVPTPAFLTAARRLLAAKRARYGAGPWGWKDPRTTLFLDVWTDLIPDLRVVAVVRPPRLVVNSLCARLGAYFSIARKDLFLRTYVHYNRKILAHAERHPGRVNIVAIERLLADPACVLGRLSDALGHPCAVEAFEAVHHPEVMSRVGRASLIFNRRVLRDAESLYRRILRHSL